MRTNITTTTTENRKMNANDRKYIALRAKKLDTRVYRFARLQTEKLFENLKKQGVKYGETIPNDGKQLYLTACVATRVAIRIKRDRATGTLSDKYFKIDKQLSFVWSQMLKNNLTPAQINDTYPDAMDCLQTSTAVLCEYIGQTYTPDIYKIIRRACDKDLYNTRKVTEKEVPSCDFLDFGYYQLVDDISGGNDHISLYIAALFAIADLKQPALRAICMYARGLSVEHIADLEGVNKGSIYSRLSVAQKHLKRAAKELEDVFNTSYIS